MKIEIVCAVYILLFMLSEMDMRPWGLTIGA